MSFPASASSSSVMSSSSALMPPMLPAVCVRPDSRYVPWVTGGFQAAAPRFFPEAGLPWAIPAATT